MNANIITIVATTPEQIARAVVAAATLVAQAARDGKAQKAIIIGPNGYEGFSTPVGMALPVRWGLGSPEKRAVERAAWAAAQFELWTSGGRIFDIISRIAA